jgi:RNA polymerase sigma factor (sigma-70 family)
MSTRAFTAEHGARKFPSTEWTQVLDARSGKDADRRREAMARLLESYWRPAYFFIRRRGYGAEAARDLTQSFFTTFLEKNFLQYVDRARGRFSTFLRTALDHHLSDQRDRARAQKRGGGAPHVSLDRAAPGPEIESVSITRDDPERLFRRQQARAVIGRALETLRDHYRKGGRLREYEALVPSLVEPGRQSTTYADLAQSLAVTELDITNRLHRMRKLYREAIWGQLRAATVDDLQAREELRELFAAFDES